MIFREENQIPQTMLLSEGKHIGKFAFVESQGSGDAAGFGQPLSTSQNFSCG